MKISITKLTASLILAGSIATLANTTSATQIYGTGSNFGSGYSIIGNQAYGTGSNFGGGWMRKRRTDFVSPSNTTQHRKITMTTTTTSAD